jgi:hypothetical protein
MRVIILIGERLLDFFLFCHTIGRTNLSMGFNGTGTAHIFLLIYGSFVYKSLFCTTILRSINRAPYMEELLINSFFCFH